jgi:hypothetical protein
MMMMRTGRIPERRAVEGADLAMALTMNIARVRRTRRAVRNVAGKGTEQRTGRGNGRGNGTGKGIVKPTPGADDISRAVPLQLQKEMYESDSDTEG